jgi:cell division protein ZapE
VGVEDAPAGAASPGGLGPGRHRDEASAEEPTGRGGAGRLVDRHPQLGADELVARFVPPHRFEHVRFDNYIPNPEFPSQRRALDAMRAFAEELQADARPAKPRRWWRRDEPAEAPGRMGRYLDGGYGVGKTHLLAALWHAVPEPAAYLTFAELTAVIGFVGMADAVEAFSGYRLICLDEFELDDVANTLMAVSFLRGLLPAGTRVAATSNTLPDRLGEGRFQVDDFRREVAAIADHFEVLRVDGPDYRGRSGVVVDPLDDGELDRLASAAASAGRALTVDSLDDLLPHLRRVHTVQYPAMLDGLDAVFIRGLHPIANQGDALLFVHLVDELYDAGLTVAASGCPVGDLFPPSFRSGGYRKKYGRCESRLSAMLSEVQSEDL